MSRRPMVIDLKGGVAHNSSPPGLCAMSDHTASLLACQVTRVYLGCHDSSRGLAPSARARRFVGSCRDLRPRLAMDDLLQIPSTTARAHHARGFDPRHVTSGTGQFTDTHREGQTCHEAGNPSGSTEPRTPTASGLAQSRCGFRSQLSAFRSRQWTAHR